MISVDISSISALWYCFEQTSRKTENKNVSCLRETIGFAEADAGWWYTVPR